VLRPFGRRPGRDDAEIVDFLKDAFSLKKIAPARQAAFDVINLTMLSIALPPANCMTRSAQASSAWRR